MGASLARSALMVDQLGASDGGMEPAAADPLLAPRKPASMAPAPRGDGGAALAPLPTSNFPESFSAPHAPPPPPPPARSEPSSAEQPREATAGAEGAEAEVEIDELGADALRSLASAQRLQLLQLRPQIASAESERVKLARRVASLTAERDGYLQGVTQASQQLAAAQRAQHAAAEAHARERQDDNNLFQANLRRLLSEKAKLHEEAEM